MESKWVKKRQHVPKKVLKVPKISICKKGGFTIMVKPYFLSLGGSQYEHKRLKTALNGLGGIS